MKRLLSFVTVTIILLASCQAAFAGTSPAGFDAITANEIKSSKFAPSPFRVSKDSEGTILLYKTNRGRYGKLVIREYSSYKNTLTVLTINFTTYSSNGSVYKQGRNLAVSVQGCDLDTGKSTSGTNADIKCAANLAMPANGAVFALYKNPAFAVQGVQRICKVPNLVSFQVQYYIPPEHAKECFISAYIPNKANKNVQFRCDPAGGTKGVPKGQHYFTDNVIFDAKYTGSKLLTTSSIEVVIYDRNRQLCSKVIRWRETWEKLTLPSRFTFCGKNPKDSHLGPVDSEEIQGIAHSRTHWYISNKNKIYKTQKNQIKSVVKQIHIDQIQNRLRSGHYEHFGDMDFYNGYLYVATTGKIYDSSRPAPVRNIPVGNAPPLVVVFDQNLNFIKYGKFPPEKQKGAGWLAINPLTEYLYSSEPYRNLHIYSRNFSNGSFLQPVGDIWLNFKYGAPNAKEWGKVWNQGGAFSPKGIFYYVLDHKADENCNYTGIHAFIIKKYASEITIRGKNNKNERVNFMNEKYDPDQGKWRKWELEGITIWDRGTEGQIHMLQLCNEGGRDDDVHLFHYKVNNDY